MYDSSLSASMAKDGDVIRLASISEFSLSSGEMTT